MITPRNGLPFQLTSVDDPARSERSQRCAPGAVQGRHRVPHSRTTTVLLGEPINATREAMTDGSTVSKLAWTLLERLVGVPEHKFSQSVERVKILFTAEEDAYAGRGVEVLVDPSDEHLRIELVFDRMLDCSDTRGRVVSVLNAAAAKLAAGQQPGLQLGIEHQERLGDVREHGTAAGTAA